MRSSSETLTLRETAGAPPQAAVILPELPAHAEAVEALNAFTFGPGRFTKTAYRLRHNNPPVLAYNRICMLDGALIGAVCFSRIRVGPQRALLLGPLVVHPDHKHRGIGHALMRIGIDTARAEGEELVVLVGDAPYYARSGFAPVPRGQMRMPGPVDPGRLLARELVDGAMEKAVGPIKPDG